MKTKIISIDFQKDFASPDGICYRPRESVNFVKTTLIPYLLEKNIKIAEIISDYRQPRLGDRGDCCKPGDKGYESEIPDEVKDDNVWIKCMNSPIWVRDNIGDKDKTPGLPHQDPEAFDTWLVEVVGDPKDTQIILIGLTLDCCVLCAAQELDFRGYTVKILKEAVDTYFGDQDEKEDICDVLVRNWADVISWEEVKKLL